MKYPHLVVISAAGNEAPPDNPTWEPAEQDPDEGIFEQWPDRVFAHGRADCQDVGATIVYEQDMTNDRSDAVIFLKDERVIYDIRSGMRVDVVFDPLTGEIIRDAVIEKVTILDGSLWVKWL